RLRSRRRRSPAHLLRERARRAQRGGREDPLRHRRLVAAQVFGTLWLALRSGDAPALESVAGVPPAAHTSRVLPASATRDARTLLFTRGVRGFADGVVSVLLASYLGRLGFSALQIGAIVTATLLGSAVLTLAIGLLGHRYRRRAVLLGAAGLMVATGLGFFGVTAFWPLLAIAFVGTVNPSAGDVTLFLPTEQTVLAETSDPRDRTGLFAWYNLTGTFAGAAGALAAGFPAAFARRSGMDIASAERAGFLVYSALGIVAAFA